MIANRSRAVRGGGAFVACATARVAMLRRPRAIISARYLSD
jgi:hypothetical protein